MYVFGDEGKEWRRTSLTVNGYWLLAYVPNEFAGSLVYRSQLSQEINQIRRDFIKAALCSVGQQILAIIIIPGW